MTWANLKTTIGAVFSAAGGAELIGNTPAGNIAATTVQAAINELDTEKASLAQLNAIRISNYSYTAWNPSDVAGTLTTAPATGTNSNSAYASQANSSGTVTVTFNIAGSYLVSIGQSARHANAYTNEGLFIYIGGTATRLATFAPSGYVTYSGDSATDSSEDKSTSTLIVATAGQTLTVLPKYSLTGAGVVGDHNAYASVLTVFCGS
jgi:hypothetical protein